MYKVLLVEGAEPTRKAIISMVSWEQHFCQLVGEASNGEQGLRLFRNFAPEIVITDIQMPVMDGLEMVRHIQSEAPATQFILLSAHEDFEYARQGIALGVSSYILKREMSNEAFSRALERAKDRLRANSKLNFLSTNVDIKAFLRRGAAGTSLSEMPAFSQIQLLCAPAVQQTSLSYMDNFDYWSALNSRFCDYGKITSVVISDIENLVLVSAGKLNSKQRIRTRGLAFAQDFQKYHKENYHFDMHIALGGLCTTEKQLYDSYLRTRSLLMDGVFNQEAAIVETQPKAVDEKMAYQVKAYMQTLKRLVEERRYEEAKEPAATMMDYLRKVRSPLLFQEVVISTEQLLGEHAKRNGFVYPYTTITQAEKALLATLNSLEQEQSSKYSRRVRQMLQYIHQYYPSDIDLNSLAGELGITAIYAGQIFKKEIGQTFTSYLTECRIRRATKLLESGKYKIREVSEMVGYRSVPYFSRVFKRTTGKNPRAVLETTDSFDNLD